MPRAPLLALVGVGLMALGCVDGKTPDCSTPNSGCFPGDAAAPQPDASDAGDASPANDAAVDADADSSTDAPID